ncbi:hypothetical protein [Streptomyces sp. NPDC047108]|uniref:hypothetical protein n=1 Tax=Streptomyces sp. NPDC047108 TaxID=3155025 RepID=UPI0033D01F99
MAEPPGHRPLSRTTLGQASVILAGLGLTILVFLGVVGANGPARALFWVAAFLVTAALALGLDGARRLKRGYADRRSRCLTGTVLGGLATVWCINGAVAATDPFHHVSCRPAHVDTAPSTEETAEGSPSSTAEFGTTSCFENGVQATVAAPEPSTPHEMRNEGQRENPGDDRTVTVHVTIRNGSTNIIDLEEFFTIGAKDADGRTAEAVFEGEDHSSGLGKTMLLPGMKKVITQRFTLPPSAAKSMAVEANTALPQDRRGAWSGPDESAWWSGRVH